MNHPFSRGNIKTVFATSTRKLLIHSFILNKYKTMCLDYTVQPLRSLCWACSSLLPPSFPPHHLLWSISHRWSIHWAYSFTSLWFFTRFSPSCYHLLLLSSTPLSPPVLWILEPHVPFTSSAPKFYPSSSIKHWKRHISTTKDPSLLFMCPGFDPKWTLIGFHCSSDTPQYNPLQLTFQWREHTPVTKTNHRFAR